MGIPHADGVHLPHPHGVYMHHPHGGYLHHPDGVPYISEAPTHPHVGVSTQVSAQVST